MSEQSTVDRPTIHLFLTHPSRSTEGLPSSVVVDKERKETRGLGGEGITAMYLGASLKGG